MLLEFVKDYVDGLAVGAVSALVNCGVGVGELRSWCLIFCP